MKAFPRSSKYTLCLLGLVPATELGGCLSLGDPRAAPPCDASARAQSGASSPAGLCCRAPTGSPAFKRVPGEQQEPCGCRKPPCDVHVGVLRVGSIFH